MRVVASQAAPIPEAVAIPRVQQFLGNQLAGEAATTELKKLKAKAKITYQGEFADAAGNVSTPAVTAPAASAPKANAIEKGAAGLK
jgi:23S rRNA-/tRNA-specific pseudouridylate synthase